VNALMQNREQIVNHFFEKLKTSPVVTEPFSHMIIEDIFPKDFYKEILAHVPKRDQFISQANSAFPKLRKYDKRLEFKLTPDRISELPEEQFSFWNDMCEWLLGQDLVEFLLEKFSSELKQRFQIEDLASLEPHPVACINRDLTGYSLGPHTDAPKKMFVLLFYLPKNEEHAHLGTSIFAPKEDGLTDKSGAHFCFDGFDEVDCIPNKPNSMMLCCWNDQSWHGVKKILEEGIERDTLMYNLNDQRLETIENLESQIIN
jgi:hypothetical protein